jgi:homoserine O-acetyltransferase
VEDLAQIATADLLVQLAKWRRADVARHTDGDLAAALRRITARVSVAAFSHDGWFPLDDCRAEQELICGSSFDVIGSVWGHYAWGITSAESDQIEKILAAALAT